MPDVRRLDGLGVSIPRLPAGLPPPPAPVPTGPRASDSRLRPATAARDSDTRTMSDRYERDISRAQTSPHNIIIYV